MITYRRCTEVNKDAVFQAFQIGFSDYMIKMDLTKDVFLKRFFGPEGNSLEYSLIAFDEEKPIGLNLGGIKVYEGIKTLRCGALCIHPEYRGTEVAGRLFQLHREIAIENECRQMFLEVIAGNDRAISFYKKMGYEKVYDIVYYSHQKPSEIKGELPDEYTIQRITMDDLKSLSDQIQDIHINWQNDFDYINHSEGHVHYGVYQASKLSGGLSIHPSGKISFLWIAPKLRSKGIGRGMINHAVRELQLQKLLISFPNNAALSGFVKYLDFRKNEISQYEMYRLV